MVNTEGLSPADPVRWWLAYTTERELAEQENRDQTGGQDIQMVTDDTPTL